MIPYNMDDNIFTSIKDQVKNDYEYFKNKFVPAGYELFILAPYGSMNYGLYKEGESDIDYKAVIIPSTVRTLIKTQLCNQIQTFMIPYVPYNTVNERMIEVMDIRIFIDNLLKKSINFCECVYSPFTVYNPDYYIQWLALTGLRHELGTYSPNNTIGAVYGHLHNALKRFHSETSKQSKQKQIANSFRLKQFILNYINGVSYEKCIIAPPSCWELKFGNIPQEELIKTDKGITAWVEAFDFEIYRQEANKTQHSTMTPDEFIKAFDEVAISAIEKGVYK